jgi:hypothetical protein
MNNWHYSRETTFVCPKGQYYVGDLCYALDEETYSKVFGGKNYSDGLYQHENGKEVFMVSGTAVGDGEYRDTLGRSYGVDSGTIGICPIEMAKKGTYGGQVVTFDKAFKVNFYGGLFEFDPADWSEDGRFSIDTGFGDDDEDSE